MPDDLIARRGWMKFTAPTGEAGKLIGFGLSRENVAGLIAGDPIIFSGAAIGEAHREFVIFFGETEAQMREQFRECRAWLTSEMIEDREAPDA